MGNRSWKQTEFYISTFEAIRGDQGDFRKILEANKEAGINLVEIVFKDRDLVTRILDVCESLGIRTIVQDPAFCGIGDNMVITDDETVKSSIAYYSKYQHIAGYYLWDEPVEAAFDYCSDTKLRFSKFVAPDKILLFAAFPSYGVYTWKSGLYNWEENTYTSYIEKYLDVIDPPVVCFDYYPCRNETMDLVESDLWRDMGYLSRKARKLDKPFWFYFQGVDMETGIGSIAKTKISAQMYAAVAYNAKAVSWFVTADVLTDLQGGKRENYEELKKLNHEVMNLGRFMFSKELDRICHTSISMDHEKIYYLDSLNDSEYIRSAPDCCIVSEFTDSGSEDRYCLLVNKQHDRRAEGRIEFNGLMEISVFNQTINEAISHGESNWLEVSLDRGDCLSFIIKKKECRG
ncbi:MAG: hypothetical protein ACYCYM_01375 [Saccharofermentanales bacterium]